MNILVTLNSNYMKPLKIMLYSLFVNNEGEAFTIYLMHSSMKEAELSDINQYIADHGQSLEIITVTDDYFKGAPVLKHYTKEMYYRLLAFKFLPSELDKILYLDPDILVINEIRTLYDMDISGSLYAAAYHEIASVTEINKLRLKPYDMEAYYNSGVLLMNLDLQREKMKEQEIFDYVEENKKRLLYPDQDIINALYSQDIKNLDEVIYNYDPRYYRYYKAVSSGKMDVDYVIHNTRFIHYRGKKKPWNKNYTGKFHSIYKHYEKEALTE
ncbi:glycosyltransferase family 8 protein [Virgibacillus sp. NKC19-16]|uniref:glycosyltransferase family 8 protein n=1 Tax=Virgibacillus salidurans TaxID=2831673 RepID=UPI001F25CF3E|nr:glycosyltransferase family 8 protein [Virgibacillus sp. NKC19-16]UJL46299.1 glycosyltransferase family 8 protein [Virgibacillus sp. NKC19-16]